MVEVPPKAAPPKPQPLELPEASPQPSEKTAEPEEPEAPDPGWGALSPGYQKALKQKLAQCTTEEERRRFMVSIATERTRPRKPKNTEPSNLELTWGELLSPKDAERAKRPSLTEEKPKEKDKEPEQKVEQPLVQPKPAGPPKKESGDKRETALTRRAFVGGLASFLQRCRPDLMAAPAASSTSPAPEAPAAAPETGAALAASAATASTSSTAEAKGLLALGPAPAPLALAPAGASSKATSSSEPPLPLPPPTNPPPSAKPQEAAAASAPAQPMLQRAGSLGPHWLCRLFVLVLCCAYCCYCVSRVGVAGAKPQVLRPPENAQGVWAKAKIPQAHVHGLARLEWT